MNIHYFKRQFRLAGYTQRSFAKKVGIHHSTISHVFNGRRKLALDEAPKWARTLNVPVLDVIENALGHGATSAFDDFAKYELDSRLYFIDQTELADALITYGHLYKDAIFQGDLHGEVIKLLHSWRTKGTLAPTAEKTH